MMCYIHYISNSLLIRLKASLIRDFTVPNGIFNSSATSESAAFPQKKPAVKPAVVQKEVSQQSSGDGYFYVPFLILRTGRLASPDQNTDLLYPPRGVSLS